MSTNAAARSVGHPTESWYLSLSEDDPSGGLGRVCEKIPFVVGGEGREKEGIFLVAAGDGGGVVVVVVVDGRGLTGLSTSDAIIAHRFLFVRGRTPPEERSALAADVWLTSPRSAALFRRKITQIRLPRAAVNNLWRSRRRRRQFGK